MSEFTSNDPSEIYSTPPHQPSREQTAKTVQDKWPGHISWASDRANFAGCRVITFSDRALASGLEQADSDLFAKQLEADGRLMTAQEMMNLYFSTRANLLVVQMLVAADSSVTVLVTTQMDADDLEELQEVQTRVNLDMREWRKKRADEREKVAAAAREERRLIEVGRNAETYNLAGRIRDLEAELSKAKAASNAT